MTTPILTAPATNRRMSALAGRNNQPDPRPITEYAAEYSEVAGHSRIKVTLAQPCIIRNPAWQFVSCFDGTLIKAPSVTVESNTVITFEFDDVIDTMIAFVEVPYQDMEVQNFQGGFVRSGGQWFRKAS